HHFGLGPSVRAEVRAIWPDGTVSDWVQIEAGQGVTLAR
ncbi:MAG: ASPIC/UnbV domain-containing protein, partial [Cypionkella sp.]